jgi:hypothetical protein
MSAFERAIMILRIGPTFMGVTMGSQNDGGKWSRRNIFEIPPCTHHVIFITEFVLLIKIPPFYEVNSF